MEKESSGHREPKRGDKVYDDTYEQWGTISAGVYEFVGDKEVFTDILVDFKVLRVWYKPDELRPHWVGEKEAYILP